MEAKTFNSILPILLGGGLGVLICLIVVLAVAFGGTGGVAGAAGIYFLWRGIGPELTRRYQESKISRKPLFLALIVVPIGVVAFCLSLYFAGAFGLIDLK